MQVNFWFDPICPWCWLTSRWILQVAPERNLSITWRSISLFIKNDLQPGDMFYEQALQSRNLLRIVEALRATGDEDKIGDFYTYLGTKKHSEKKSFPTVEEITAEFGLTPSQVAAIDDEKWDQKITESMDAGFALTGKDVGVPLIGCIDDNGVEVGFFGPVISRQYDVDDAVKLWDGVLAVASTPGFWELKRTRTEEPQIEKVDHTLQNDSEHETTPVACTLG